ncbi:MAG: hypothetical protein JWM80_6207 [Cyanobacteria bacterium RYN_339]|nr:hypothetical protein [Cyanobacteria bacterium RYN_339]
MAPAQGDRIELGEAAVRPRVHQMLLAVRNLSDVTKLAELDAEAVAHLGRPGLAPETQGLLHLVRSATLGQLALNKVDRGDNGKAAWAELHLAVAQAPERIEVAQVHSRTVLGLSKLNAVKRFFVCHYVGADLKKEARVADGLLAKFPDDPKCVLVRALLVEVHHEKAIAKLTAEAVARLDARDPRGMAAARAELGGDSARVASADAAVQEMR